jgi:hypothetical protein
MDAESQLEYVVQDFINQGKDLDDIFDLVSEAYMHRLYEMKKSADYVNSKRLK